jgi:ketosteroid isomerase-like protein
MYHALVRRRVRRAFEQIGEDGWRAALRNASEAIHHSFAGRHALGGERHSRQVLEQWFERVERLFPGMTFEVRHVASVGWPWSTWVAVEWTNRATAADGEPYFNHGTHWAHVRWGTLTRLHGFPDTQHVEEACRRMAASGIEEAAAEPIED